MTTPHHATPAEWKSVRDRASLVSSDSCLLEIRDRLNQLKINQDANTRILSVIDSRSRIDGLQESLEQALRRITELERRPQDKLDRLIAQDADDTEPQTLHSIALQMVESLGRSFHLLPEILDTLRRAIREPMEPAAGVTIKPPRLSDVEALELWQGPGPEESSLDLVRRIHRAGWDDAMAAVATQRHHRQEPAPCPHIRSSDEGTSYCALAESNSQPTPNDRQIRNSIRAAADWLLAIAAELEGK